MKRFPLYLIYSRLLFSLAIVVIAVLRLPHFQIYMIVLLLTGVFTDILDGIIFRKLNISDQELRRLDASVGQVFWITVFTSTCFCCPAFFHEHDIKLAIVIGMEVLTYIISFSRFKKEVAVHAISSKIWTLTILATIIQVVLTCHSTILFEISFYVGIATRLEIMLILLIIRQWHSDVPSVYHAVQLRKGKEIKRYKLFNN